MISASRFDVSPAPSLIPWAARLLAALFLAAGLLACQSEPDAGEQRTEDADGPPVVDVTAVDYAFAAPDTVRSGWTTFRMTNKGEEHHLFALSGLPEGVTYADFHNNVAVPLDSMRTQVRMGAIDTATARKNLSRMLPDWFPQESTPMGGVSLTAPGRTARTALKLEPGSYVMECYVRTDERRFHFLRGMAKPLVVTTDSTDASPPEADLSISLSKGQMQADSVVSAGAHTVAVHFGEKAKTDPLYLFNQHLHLARLDGGISPDTLAEWMKWDPIMPAPAEFLGGPQSMLADHTAYMQVDLSPGRYAWVLGNPPKQGAVQPLTVE
jgi:hypothetical protein